MSDTDFDSVIEDMSEMADAAMPKGRNSRSSVTAYGYRFDSKEELDVFEWILEAKELGFVDKYEYQPERFVLFEGLKNERGKFVVRPHVYTADFRIGFTEKWVAFRRLNRIRMFDKLNERDVYIDVKGTWSIYDDGRSFQINQKWVLGRYGVYVWKVIPVKLFEKTWLPKKCVLTRKTKKISAKYSKFKVFDAHDFRKTD